jgi:hypothetical protein
MFGMLQSPIAAVNPGIGPGKRVLQAGNSGRDGFKMGVHYIPQGDQGIKSWADNFHRQLDADPGRYGVTSSDVATVATYVDAFKVALRRASDPETRTKPTIAAKDGARAAMLFILRGYAQQIRLNRGIGNAAKLDLGLRIPDTGRSPRRSPRRSWRSSGRNRASRRCATPTSPPPTAAPNRRAPAACKSSAWSPRRPPRGRRRPGSASWSAASRSPSRSRPPTRENRPTTSGAGRRTTGWSGRGRRWRR